MGRYIQQSQTRSELQQRIAAELRAKAAAKAKDEGGEGGGYYDERDGVNDSEYIKGTKQTTSLAWAWALIFFLAIGAFIYFVILANQ